MVAPVKLNGSRHGSPPSDPPKTETEVSAEVVRQALRSRFNPIRGITPKLLSTQLDQFALGYVAYAALLWDAIERRDDVLRNVSAKRKKDAARLDWEVLTVDGDQSADALAHKEALEDFYNNVEAVNALDENERGGFPLLVRQMMDAVGKYYAVHEIVWKPGEVLTAQCRFVPLWFFENTTGRLQYMSIPLGGIQGRPLEDGGWMITKGDGLMEACSVAYMFKNLPLKDWLAYSDKFGTPGILGRSNAAKDSPAGDAMRDAVRDFGQNWSAVVYGDDGAIKDPISLVEPKGSSTTLPFQPLIERMDRAMISLWRGSDLSTMSGAKEHNVGSNAQSSESNLLLYDDAAVISETLNYYIDRWVLWQKFGVGMESGRPALAYIKILAPEDEDLELDLKIDEFLLNAGARIGEKDRLEYYGRSQAAEGDTPLHAPAKVAERLTPKDATGQVAAGVETLPNIRVIAADADLEQFLGPLRDDYLKALANDLHPLRIALANALQGVENGPDLTARLIMLRARLPEILKEVNANPRSAKPLAEIIANAMARGFEQAAKERAK